LALRYSYDPLTGRLDVGFNPDEQSSAKEAPPRVTPSNSKTIPKAVPQGGSAPQKELIKPYYLAGEKAPEGIQTKLERVDVDGKMRLARVPVLPDLTPEQQARVDEAANAKQFTYGYDPKSGEFATGVVDVPKEDPIQKTREFIERKPKINSVGDALESAANLTPLYNEKIDLGLALADAERKGDDKRVLDLRKKIQENDEKLGAESSRRGDNFTNEFFVDPLYNLFDDPLNSLDKLTTGTALVLGESLGPMVSQMPRQAGEAAGVVAGLRPVYDPGVLAALTSYYYGTGASDQYLNNYRQIKETYGENADTVLGGLKLDQDKVAISAAGQTAIDLALGKVASLAGGLVFAPLKASSIVGRNVLPKTLKRAGGITAAIAGGASTEWAQNYLQEWGNAVDLGFLDVLDDPERRGRINEGALVGGIIGGNLATIPAAVGTVRDSASLINDALRGRKIAKETKARVGDFESNVDNTKNLDTSVLGVETTPEVTEVTKPEPIVVDKPKPAETATVEEKPKAPAYDSTEGARNSVAMWNEYYNSRVEAFEQTQNTPRTPGEIYQSGESLGLPVGQIYSRIVGDETTPVDAGTPQVKVANNLIKSVVEAAEAQKFYTDLGKDPEAQNLYLDAIEQSRENPERQAKISKVKEAIPSVPGAILDTLPNQELDAIANKFPDTQKEISEVLDNADETLSPETEELVELFVGHGKKSRDKRDMDAFGIMDATPLEAAVRNKDARYEEIRIKFTPVRDSLRNRYGDTVPLYRVQDEVNPTQRNASVPRDGLRAILSWTLDPKFAETYAGVTKPKKVYTEQEIKEKTAEYKKNGRLQLSKTKWLEPWEEDANYVQIMDDNVGGFVTTIDNVAEYFEDENEYAIEYNKKQENKRKRIIKQDIPVDNILWATDRAGQNEFIVENIEGKPGYINPRGKLEYPAPPPPEEVNAEVSGILDQNSDPLAQVQQVENEVKKANEADPLAIPASLDRRGTQKGVAKDSSGSLFGTAFGEVKKTPFKRGLNVASDSFKNWFGKSKVKDLFGRPLRLFHGTGKNFNVFSNEADRNLAPSSARGYYFTEDPIYASGVSYGYNKDADWNPMVVPVYLKIENPYYIKKNENFNVANITEDKIKELKAKGYDGIIQKKLDGKFKLNEYVVFEPTQIKSVFNKGDFAQDNPDIMLNAGTAKSFNVYDKNIDKRIEEVPYYSEYDSPILRSVLEELAPKFLSNLEFISRRLLGDKTAAKVDGQLYGDLVVRGFDKTTGQEVGAESIGGIFDENQNIVKMAVGDFVKHILEGDGKLTPPMNSALKGTMIHEITHAADMLGLLGNRTDRTFIKALKDARDNMARMGGYEWMKNFDPNNRIDKSEIIAYNTEFWVKTSDDAVAKEMRNLLGMEKVLIDVVPLPKTLQGTIRRAALIMLEALKQIRTAILNAIGKQSREQQLEQMYRDLVSGKFGRDIDNGVVSALKRQTDAIYKAAERKDALFSAKLATGAIHRTDTPIAESLEWNTKLAEVTPDDMGDMQDQIVDPDNNKGWAYKPTALLQKLRVWAALARFDGDAARSFWAAINFQRESTLLHRAWERSADWLRNHPNKNVLCQVLLDLRKQQKSFIKDVNEDGSMYYYDRKGVRVRIPKIAVDELKEVSRVFSLPLDAMVKVSRRKLKNLNSRPNIDIPADGTAAQLLEWADKTKKELDDTVVKSPIDRKYFNRARELINNIAETQQYLDSGLPYIPEMRKGNWAFAVKDKNGKLVGLYTFEHNPKLSNKGPDKKKYGALLTKIKEKYKNEPDLTISEQPFELTYNALAKAANPSQVDINLITSLVAQRMQGILGSKMKAKGYSDDLASLMQGEDPAADVMAYYQARGFGRHFLNSEHIDGMSEDWDWVTSSFFTSGAKSVAHMKYADLFNLIRSAYKQEAARSDARGVKFKQLLDNLDYALDPAADAPFIRSFSYLWGLAYNPSTAALQLAPLGNQVVTDMVSIGMPVTKTLSAFTQAFKAMAVATKGQFTGDGVWETDILSPKQVESHVRYFSEKDRDYASKAIMDNRIVLAATLPQESLNSAGELAELSRGGRAWKNFTEGGAWMMNLTERSARLSTYMVYLKTFLENPDALKRALEVYGKEPLFTEYRRFNPQLDDTQAASNYAIQNIFGFPEKAARPMYTRGRIGATISPFMGLPSQMFEYNAQMLGGLRGKRGFLGAVAAGLNMAAWFGAYAAIPTAGLFIPLAFQALDEKDVPGELQFKAIIADMIGIEGANYVTKGIIGELLDVDVSKRVGNAMPFANLLSSTASSLMSKGSMGDLEGVTGIMGSTFGGLMTAVSQYSSGRMDAEQALSLFAPAQIRNFIRGQEMMFDGNTIVSNRGKPILTSDDTDFMDAVAQSFGFAPQVVVNARQRNRLDALAQAGRSSLKSTYKQRLINLGADIERAESASEKYELKQEYNRLREDFLKVVDTIKREDPEEYETYFRPALINRFFKDVDKGIRQRLEPDTDEGASRNVKRRRDQYGDLLK
jgi:hypothetical protein